METKNIDIKKIVPNNGQIDGLPKNPRQIRDFRFEKLKKSISDAPEMLSLRELIVFPHDGKFIIIAGNMRYRACQDLKIKELPCKILDENTSVEKLREYAIKDNENFGEYDFDILANEWDAEELTEWGVELPTDWGVNADDFGTSFSLKDGDKEPFQQMAFTFADEQAAIIKNAIETVKKTEEYKYCETMGNENSNGNALYLIVKQWEDARK